MGDNRISELHDPEVEAGAIALAYIAMPCALHASRAEWWQALSDRDRDLYRYRASIVLEAVDELRNFPHAAE